MVLCEKRIIKVLISLRRCAGWSAPLSFANPLSQVFSRRGPYLNGLDYAIFVSLAKHVRRLEIMPLFASSSVRVSASHFWFLISHFCGDVSISFQVYRRVKHCKIQVRIDREAWETYWDHVCLRIVSVIVSVILLVSKQLLLKGCFNFIQSLQKGKAL